MEELLKHGNKNLKIAFHEEDAGSLQAALAYFVVAGAKTEAINALSKAQKHKIIDYFTGPMVANSFGEHFEKIVSAYRSLTSHPEIRSALRLMEIGTKPRSQLSERERKQLFELEMEFPRRELGKHGMIDAVRELEKDVRESLSSGKPESPEEMAGTVWGGTFSEKLEGLYEAFATKLRNKGVPEPDIENISNFLIGTPAEEHLDGPTEAGLHALYVLKGQVKGK